MKITVVYDNNAEEDLKPGWGFSCLIEDDKTILFDTGAEGEGLLYNLKKLKIDPKRIDIIVLSHEHGDHIGGLPDLLEQTENVTVVVPKSFSGTTKEEIARKATVKEISKEERISDNAYTTGELGSMWLKEQSLVVKTKKGFLVITGCAHPGLGNILEKAKEFGKIYGVVGGFHGFSDFEKLEGIELIGACHCTQYKEEIKERYPENFKEVKAGSVIEV